MDPLLNNKRVTAALLVGLPLWFLFVTVGMVVGATGMSSHGYVQHNLVSDDNTKIPAANQDITLLNPWGVAFFPGGPVWVNDNGSGISALYQGDGTGFNGANPALPVTIPPPAGGTSPSAPTG